MALLDGAPCHLLNHIVRLVLQFVLRVDNHNG